MILCDEFVVDGNYLAVVEVLERADRKVPVIVVSRTGDWPEYLTAIRNGAFDYVAYPPVPGELQRIIRNAFLQRE
jgi:DNA-binding NtrC family response regulator